jgi:cellulose synthase/poly-beta-1,6-N-acetylglucosamine synthase-like glycosyltransferase
MSVEKVIQYTLVAMYLGTLVAVAIYGFHRYVLVYLYLKHRHNGYQPKGKFEQLPKITVQLPMYNEDTVAERIIRATCQIDYPRDRFEIQVLDDSTDHSAEIAKLACEEWAAKGVPIVYIHRDNREGYKAGALAEGLRAASGEYIAIFDADFVPPRDILLNTVNYFTDDKVGMVQVRWDHLNRNASLLTKSQAIFLDGHFVIEHTARNRSGRFMHFNGTAGVWRRTTIDDAGGWHHDTLTEDLDLSYRAQIKGWQFVYLPQFCAPAELPPEMIAFKQQAHRWTKGSMQTAIKLLPGILRSKSLPRTVKSEAFFHLTNTLVYPLMVILTLLIWPAFFSFFNVEGPIKQYTWGHYLFSTTLFILATCSASTFFVFGQRELFGREAGWKTLFYLPVLMGLGVGVCINNAKAVLEAIWSAIVPAKNGKSRGGEFVRTPKYGGTGTERNAWQNETVRSPEAIAIVPSRVERRSFLTLKRLTLPIIEICFGIYMSIFIFISLYWQFAYASVPFLCIFAGGYFYVGFSSLYVLWKMQQDAEEQFAAQELLST